MSFVRKFGHEYYICRAKGRNNCNIKKVQGILNWFSIKNNGSGKSYSGSCILGNCIFPQEFVGKRVRIKVEVIEG